MVEALLAPMPDVGALRTDLARTHGLSPTLADEALYRLVRQLNARMFPPITSMELLLADRCNMACSYCFEGGVLTERTRNSHLMSRDMIEKAVDLLFDYAGEAKDLQVTYFGGEPTLNFDGIRTATERIAEHAKSTGKTAELHMTSNGYHMPDDMVDYFGEHAIRVLLSIDGMQEAHDAHRVDKSGHGSFETVIKNMTRLKRVQPWIGVKMTVSPAFACCLFEDVRALYDLGVNQFVIGHATGVDWSTDAQDTLCAQLGKLKDWYQAEERNDLRLADFDEDEDDDDAPQAVYGCGAGRNTISVACNGEISGCSRIMTLEPGHVVGKLGDLTHGLYVLSERMEQISCVQLKRNCAEGGIAQEYQGGCFATNYEANTNLYQPNLFEHRLSVLKKQRGVA